MSRRNHSKRRPQARRREPGALPPIKRNPKVRPKLEELIVPKGRCYFRSRHGKLRFSADDIATALEQAKRSREAKGLSNYSEERAYECPDGGCGDWHLTSRKEWVER